MKLIPLFVLVLAGIAAGQTTRPATCPAVGYSYFEMRDEIVRLKAEIELLRAEVTRLHNENVKLSLASLSDAKIEAAMRQGRLTVGMTIEQADTALKKKFGDQYSGYTVEAEAKDQTRYNFNFKATFQRGKKIADGTFWWAWVKGGKIVEWGKE